MIDSKIYSDLLNSLSLGSSVAEQDEFLERAKIETPVFDDFIADKIDLILGTKGSGKTSLFRLVYEDRESLLDKAHVLIITGVEPQGDAVFKLFTPEFKKFSEEEFENFWKIYFVNLIYNDFLIKPELQAPLKSCENEIRDFINECAKIGVPQIRRPINLKDLVARSLAAIRPRPIKKIKGGIEYNIQNPTLFKPEIEVEFADPEKPGSQLPVYVSDIGMLLEQILAKIGYRIWILLDRLDVVFEHSSDLEFLALRGLLKAYESFQVRSGKSSKALRIKVFLRDDIFSFLTSPEQFKKISIHKAAKLAALTHITARATKTPLKWTKEQIQQLLLKRLFLSLPMRSYFKKSQDDLDKEDVRKSIWNEIFGEKIEPGKKRPDSLSWIYTRLSDSRQQVTPRSAIDFLIGVVDEQKRLFNLNKIDQERFFSFQAIKQGIVVASDQKYTQETKNEYPKIIPFVERLRGRSANISLDEIEKMFGKDYEQILSELEKIGVLSKIGQEYKVTFIFRAALGVHPQF